MYGLTEHEMGASLPLILESSTLAFYTTKLPKMASYEDKIKIHRDEFTSEERRNRLLRMWQGMSLRSEMGKHPEKSQVEVFKLVYRILTKIQRQIHPDYHSDRFLSDNMVISAELP
jgi:hypothetical protein